MLRDSLLRASTGLVIGLAGAVVTGRAFRGWLFEVSPVDLLSLALVALGAAVVVSAVARTPVRRARRVDQVRELGAE